MGIMGNQGVFCPHIKGFAVWDTCEEGRAPELVIFQAGEPKREIAICLSKHTILVCCSRSCLRRLTTQPDVHMVVR